MNLSGNRKAIVVILLFHSTYENRLGKTCDKHSVTYLDPSPSTCTGRLSNTCCPQWPVIFSVRSCLTSSQYYTSLHQCLISGSFRFSLSISGNHINACHDILPSSIRCMCFSYCSPEFLRMSQCLHTCFASDLISYIVSPRLLVTQC